MDENKDIQIQVKKIPAFTVLKNGSILKNIFLLNKPSAVDTSSINQESDEQVLLVGRHPHCNITLEHPSISRYHLRIHSNPSSHMLSVIDLSSVHGTWVSGKRIEPGVHVKLKEGDTVRMGGSSRIYELHWVPISQAYDVDDPFVPTVYSFKEEEEEEEEEETNQDEDCSCLEKLETHSSDVDLESLNMSLSNTSHYLDSSCDDAEVESSTPSKTGNENDEIFSTVLVQSPLIVSETISAIENSDNQNKSVNQSNGLRDNMNDEFELLNHETIKNDQFPVPNCSKPSCDDTEVEHSSPSKIGNDNGEIFTTVSETISATEISDCLNEPEDLLSHGTVNDDLVSVALVDAHIKHEKDALTQDIARINELGMGSVYEPVNQQKIENGSVHVALFDGASKDEDWSFMSDRAGGKDVNVDCEFEQMNQTKMTDEPASVFLFDGVDSKVDDDVLCTSIISRGEEVDVDLEQTSTPDISRAKEVHMNMKAMKNVPISMNLFDSLDGNDLEIFTPDKENKNPNSCSVKSLKKRGKEDDHKQPNYCTMSKKAVSPIVNLEKDIFDLSTKLFTIVDESNNVQKETKSRPIKMKGSCNSINYPQTVQKGIDSSQNFTGGAKKRWTMVVDTNSLLHNESLKHLKLLQGLKGTQILIPKIVVRELMDIKGQHELLKKSTKRVSLALKWIDECMINTRWWIHVDDELLHSSEAEQVLETALHLCKEITDRKIIILSNDLTLKIKAMAEGVMCEAAGEFHRSLVNPFSERFMWVGSLARGPTWSSVDDDLLRQNYKGCALNATNRLKGLRLLARITTFR